MYNDYEQADITGRNRKPKSIIISSYYLLCMDHVAGCPWSQVSWLSLEFLSLTNCPRHRVRLKIIWRQLLCIHVLLIWWTTSRQWQGNLLYYNWVCQVGPSTGYSNIVTMEFIMNSQMNITEFQNILNRDLQNKLAVFQGMIRVKTEATETVLTKQETKKHSSFWLTCCLKRDTPDVS